MAIIELCFCPKANPIIRTKLLEQGVLKRSRKKQQKMNVNHGWTFWPLPKLSRREESSFKV